MARMCPVTALSVSSAIQSPKCHHHLNLDTKFLIPCRIHHNPPVNTLKFMPPVTCKISTDQHKKDAQPASATPESKNWQRCLAAALATIVIGTGMNAEADLNKYEAETRGEFGIGSAAQFGSAELRKTVHANENFRFLTETRGYAAKFQPYNTTKVAQLSGRANFTSADIRESDFSGSTFNGAYLEKAVAYKTNFTGADLSDTLMDRMVLNEANLTNAVLVRSVLTRSDLGGAIIEGADFSDAVIDFTQKQALCKYASGTNPITGISTRKSLGCGNSRRNAYGTPSAPLLSAPPEKLLDKDGFCDSSTGLCDATSTK